MRMTRGLARCAAPGCGFPGVMNSEQPPRDDADKTPLPRTASGGAAACLTSWASVTKIRPGLYERHVEARRVGDNAELAINRAG